MERKSLWRNFLLLTIMTVFTAQFASAAETVKTESSSENPTSQSCVLDAE